MASASRLARRIGSTKKARAKNPRPVAKSLQPVSPGRMKRITEENLGVLYAIENTIVQCHQQDDRIDDEVVNSVLRSVLLQDPLARMPHAWLFAELLATRDSCELDDEQTWHECLRMVRDSVQRRSSLLPGDCSYLQFVENSLG
jgi:hypothetical protein